MHNINFIESRSTNVKQVARFIRNKNANELSDLDHEMHAFFYWMKRQPRWYSHLSREQIAGMARAWRKIKKRIKRKAAPPEMTKNGSLILREKAYLQLTSFDYQQQYLSGSDWELVFRDSEFCATWKSTEAMELRTFCEGDVTIVKCHGLVALSIEINDVFRYYKG